jgi:hypothetical protein
MAAVPVYVEALPEREAVLHPEGAEIELPPEKEEELPSVSEGEETEEESPPAPEGVVVEPLSVPDRAVAEEAVAEREWRSQFHREQPQRREVVDRVEKLLSVSVFSSYKIPEGVAAERMEDLLSSREPDSALQ